MKSARGSAAAAVGAWQKIETLRAERDRFVALAFCWADVLFELDDDHRIVFVGGALRNLLGRTAEELLGLLIAEIIAPDDRGMFKLLLDIAGRRGRIEDVSIRLLGPHGPTAPLFLAGYHLKEFGGHYFLAVRSHAKFSINPNQPDQPTRSAEDNLYDAASFAKVAQARLHDSSLGDDQQLTLISLAGLIALNERLDPNTSKNLLNVVSSYLRANSTRGDSAGHIGDGRYGLVHGRDVDIKRLEEGMIEIVRSFDPGAPPPPIAATTLAIGADVTEEELAKGVLYAINKFQQSGRPDFTLKSLGTNLSSLATEAASTVDSFKRIVSAADFEIAFQPIVHTVTGQVHHFEALARFRGRYGEAPYRYITFAEETGLISNFDIAMAEKAIAWLAQNDDPGIKIAINVSGQSATNPSYTDQLCRLLEGAPATRGRLSFEVTESFRIADLHAADRFLQELRRGGYAVCLDDFGAGAAGFEYLSVLQIDVVKIDGGAIRNAQLAPKGKAFLRALVTLCRDLEVETMAEMIDSPEALDFIRGCGVDYAQGYLLGKPSYDIGSFTIGSLADLFPPVPAAPPGRKAAK